MSVVPYAKDIAAGRFCWLDLAATDAEQAKAFYCHLFGWTHCEQSANGGSFTRLRVLDRDFGSIYQLSRTDLARGVPSHWTAYIRVDDVDATAQQAVALGGKVMVRPFAVAGVARIALITDPLGADVGLWEPIEPNVREDERG